MSPLALQNHWCMVRKLDDALSNPDIKRLTMSQESWWSISAPRAWRTGRAEVDAILRDPQYVRLFDIRNLRQNRWALLIWRMSVCLQYEIKSRSCTVIVLDEGLPNSAFHQRFDMAMSSRGTLCMSQDPFTVHALFLSQVVQDWTFSFEVLQREFYAEVCDSHRQQ